MIVTSLLEGFYWKVNNNMHQLSIIAQLIKTQTRVTQMEFFQNVSVKKEAQWTEQQYRNR